MSSNRRLALRRIAAVFAGLLAIFILSTVTDVALHAIGFDPPWTAARPRVAAVRLGWWLVASRLIECRYFA
jgi:hypothetical protein